MERVPSKGRSGKTGMTGGVSGGRAGLLMSPGADGSSGLDVAIVAGPVSPCHAVAANMSSYGKGGCWRKCTRAITLLNWPNWSLKTLLGR